MNDQRAGELGLSGSGHSAVLPDVRLAARCDHVGFNVPSNDCFTAFDFVAFSTAWSAAWVASDAAFVAASRLLCATSTAYFVTFCTLS
jgi:hypothetical protein